MVSGLVVAALLGANVPQVASQDAVKQQMGQQVAVVGVVERVPISKGKGEWQGTALVLDDDTTVYVTYGAPPAGWEKLVGVRVSVEGTLLPSLPGPEQSLLAPHLRGTGTPKKEPRTLASIVGKRVRLSGVAKNAKGGAVLLIDGAPVYLAKLDAWPTETLDRLVSAGGTLVERQYLPVATKNAKGEISQGTTEGSTQLVLEGHAWRVIAGK